MIDNTTAVSVINNMGTCHGLKCNKIAVQIWEFCKLHNVTWLTAAHIPGSSLPRPQASSSLVVHGSLGVVFPPYRLNVRPIGAWGRGRAPPMLQLAENLYFLFRGYKMDD